MNELLTPLDTTEIWREEAELWEEGPMLPRPRSGGSMLNIYQGRPTMMGGKSIVSHVAEVLALDYANERWDVVEGVTMAVARSHAGAAEVPVTMFDQC